MSTLLDQAQSILALQDDWDDEGAPAYSPTVVNTALSFVEKTIDQYRAQSHQSMDSHWITPTIDPGPDGSIDIIWEFNPKQLLMNIKPGDPVASFYGDDRASFTMTGTLDSTKPACWIIFWLTN